MGWWGMAPAIHWSSFAIPFHLLKKLDSIYHKATTLAKRIFASQIAISKTLNFLGEDVPRPPPPTLVPRATARSYSLVIPNSSNFAIPLINV